MHNSKQKKDPLKISAIIPTFNRKNLTIQAIYSILTQTDPPDEIIVIDDGSTDLTRRQLTQFGNRIRYIFQNNKGVAAARNRGIRESRYDWLAFLDSDDLWTTDKLALQRRALKERPEYRISYTGEHWLRNGRLVKPGKQQKKYSGLIYEQCLPACIVAASSVLMHRSIFDAVGLFDESLPACEDYDLWLRLALRYPFLYVPHPCIIKRQGNWPSLSRQYGLDRYRIQSLKKLLKMDMPQHQKKATRQILYQKCQIYARGCTKHHRPREAEWARSIARAVWI